MAELLTVDERETMRELLQYPVLLGIHPNEARWREFARVELSLRDERIRQLEKQCEVLAAEVDRMRPVVDAAVAWYDGAANWSAVLAKTCASYQASKPK